MCLTAYGLALYTFRMDVEKFITEIGGRAAVIAETGLTKGRISQWCLTKSLPRPWIKYFREKYPEICDRHGIVDPDGVAA